MLLSKDQILAASDVLFEDVPVPEWGGTVRVRVMRGTDRDSLGAAIQKAAKAEDGSTFNYQLSLLVRCLVDELGVPVFTEADIEKLNAKSTVALDRVYAVADKLNGVGSKAVDTAEKN